MRFHQLYFTEQQQGQLYATTTAYILKLDIQSFNILNYQREHLQHISKFLNFSL